jgi:hypothetical protein
MDQIKTIEQLLEMDKEELRDYLVELPRAERLRLTKELLNVKGLLETENIAEDLDADIAG